MEGILVDTAARPQSIDFDSFPAPRAKRGRRRAIGWIWKIRTVQIFLPRLPQIVPLPDTGYLASIRPPSGTNGAGTNALVLKNSFTRLLTLPLRPASASVAPGAMSPVIYRKDCEDWSGQEERRNDDTIVQIETFARCIRDSKCCLTSVRRAIQFWRSDCISLPWKGYERAFDISTKDLAQYPQSRGQFFGIQVPNHGRVMVFAGGIPLKRRGRVVGGVGVGGGSGEQDHAIAEAGAKAF